MPSTSQAVLVTMWGSPWFPHRTELWDGGQASPCCSTPKCPGSRSVHLQSPGALGVIKTLLLWECHTPTPSGVQFSVQPYPRSRKDPPNLDTAGAGAGAGSNSSSPPSHPLSTSHPCLSPTPPLSPPLQHPFLSALLPAPLSPLSSLPASPLLSGLSSPLFFEPFSLASFLSFFFLG